MSNSHICACCGQSLPPRSIEINKDVRRIRYGSKGLSLWPSEIEFLEGLLAAYPDPAPVPDRSALPAIRKLVSRLRRKLRKTGLDVEAMYGVGYTLVFPQDNEPRIAA